MKAYLAIEVTDHKLRYVVIEKSEKMVHATRAGVSNLTLDPSAQGALTACVRDIIAKENLDIARIFLTVNCRDTVIHQLTFAKMSKADLDVLVHGEIEKIPAFAEKAFDSIYREQESENPAKSKVIFAAMSDKLLQYIINEVQQTRIPCHELEIAPLNLTGLLTSADLTNSIQSFIVLNEHATNLVVFENGQIKYLYTTNTGTDGMYPFNSVGQKQGITLGWAEELKRVLKSYSLENKKSIDKIWLLWDKEAAPKFDVYLQEQGNFSVKALDLSQEWVTEPINPINLLPIVPAVYYFNKIQPAFSLKQFFNTFEFNDLITKSLLVSALILAIVGVISGGMILRFSLLEHSAFVQLKDTQKKIAILQEKSPEIIDLKNQYDESRQQLLFQATYVKLLNRMSWSEVLSEVASELPEELSLTSFKVDDSGEVTFTGEAFTMGSIAHLLRQVNSSVILKNGKFNYLSEEVVKNKKVFRFGILADLRLDDQS